MIDRVFTSFCYLNFILLIAVSCSVRQNAEFDISGIGDDRILIESYLLSSMDEEPIFDTLISKNGKFSFNIPKGEPVISLITPEKAAYVRSDGSSFRPEHRSIQLILKPEDRVKVVGILDDNKLSYKAEFSKANEAHSKLRDGYSDTEIKRANIELMIDSLRHNNGPFEEINALFRQRKQLSSIKESVQLDFIKNNPESELAALYLIRQPLDTFNRYILDLEKEARYGIFKEILDEQYYKGQMFNKVREAKMQIQPGRKAVSFELNSFNDRVYSFNPTKSEKYVVLDFWGSWCPPCIAGFPKMKAYYKTYGNRLEIIGIACNNQENKWREAVKKHNLDWVNLINKKGDIEKDVSVAYAIETYPTKILISPEGIIEAIFEGEGDDFYTTLDQIMMQ